MFAIVEGVELVDGEFLKAEHVIDGRLGSAEAYMERAKRMYRDFLPKSVSVLCQRCEMSDEDFYKYGRFSSPEPWDIEAHKRDKNDTP
ncbi:hypothetical protein [uncultured Bifidobacterium sp.]|uniref:hypothetical protein n=1 Tax=uncultured Bifidobacterium sp. TaxID=165187 RepID=UPI00260E08F2|nr:hypothetical protein [uncultured Bifidobacterium sp.]